MPNDIVIDDTHIRTKLAPFAGCFFKCSHSSDVWMGVQWGAHYALVSLQRGILLASPASSREGAFGDAGSKAFEQITNSITIYPEL